MLPVLVLGIGIFDEARELVRSLAHGDDRTRVIHAHGSDHRHRAQLALREPVAGRHQGERAQCGELVLVADGRMRGNS